jgi:hypothetical protein
MDPRLIRTFQKQILIQCEFVLYAAGAINATLNGHHPPDRFHNTLFFAIQNLLNAAANISKAFWTQGGRRATDRQPLRDSIGISDTSPLRQVTMRNHFEHYDERLDEWWRDSRHHNHADFNMGPRDAVAIGFDDIDIFRNFDPTTTDVVFWGETFNLQALVEEVERILPRLRSELGEPDPGSPS